MAADPNETTGVGGFGGRVWQTIAAMVGRRRRAAQALVELALLLVLIAIVVLGVLTITGRRVSTVFSQVNCGLTTSAQASACAPPSGNNGQGNSGNNGQGNSGNNGQGNSGNNGQGTGRGNSP